MFRCFSIFLSVQWWSMPLEAVECFHVLDPLPDVVGMFGVQCPPGDVLWVPSVHCAWLEIFAAVEIYRSR